MLGIPTSAATSFLHFCEWLLLASSFVLTAGVVCEYRESKKWKRLFQALVIIGLAGELISDAGIITFSRRLAQLEGIAINDLAEKAKRASERADGAIADATTAKNEASKAKADANTASYVASSARREADSFEKDIAVAKRQSLDAETKLAELKAMREIVNWGNFVNKIKPFSGTPYALGVARNNESIRFLGILNSALSAAGWIRRPPPGTPPNSIMLER